MPHLLKPTTRALVTASGYPSHRHPEDDSDETYLLHEVCVWLSNEAYRRLGATRYTVDNWHTDSVLLNALSAALDDRTTDDYAAHSIARTLLRSGIDDPTIVARLAPWGQLMFRWRQVGLTVSSLNDELRRARLPQLPKESAEKVEAWLENPLQAMDLESTLPFTLFSKSAMYASLRDNGFEPRHDQLLAALLAGLSPPLNFDAPCQILVENSLEQRPEIVELAVTRENADEQETRFFAPVFDAGSGHWQISYGLDGIPRSFLARQLGTWLDVKAVLDNFNVQMRANSRADRAFQFDDLHSEHGVFIVAHFEAFPRFCLEMAIPVLPMGA